MKKLIVLILILLLVGCSKKLVTSPIRVGEVAGNDKFMMSGMTGYIGFEHDIYEKGVVPFTINFCNTHGDILDSQTSKYDVKVYYTRNDNEVELYDQGFATEYFSQEKNQCIVEGSFELSLTYPEQNQEELEIDFSNLPDQEGEIVIEITHHMFEVVEVNFLVGTRDYEVVMINKLYYEVKDDLVYITLHGLKD